MQKLFFYTKENCLLCDETLNIVELIAMEYPVEVETIDIYTDATLLEKYHVDIPVVKINEEELFGVELTFERIEKFIRRHVEHKQ